MANKTVTVKSSGGDYSSLNAALSGESANLVTNTCVLTIECYAFEDTTSASTGTGYTTSSSYYIKITAPSGNRHNGKWSTSGYRLAVNNASGLSIYEDYVIVEFLQIDVSANTGVCVGVYIAEGTLNANLITIRNSIIKCSTNSGGSVEIMGVKINDGYLNRNVLIYNSLVYDFYLRDYATSKDVSWSCICFVYGNSLTIYNCTVVNGSYGIFVANYGTVTLKNNLCKRLNSSLTDIGGSPDTVEYCATSDATADDWSGDGNRINQTFTFVDADNKDFHLASGDAGAKDCGTDLSGTFTDDIDGVTRTGTWDIGADEYVAATSVKTVQGLAIASVKTVQGLAIASVKSYQGLT